MKVSKGYAFPMLLIIALGAIGFSYAWWTEKLVINPGTVNTGELKIVWSDMYGEAPLPKYAGSCVAKVLNEKGNWAPPGTTQYLPLTDTVFTFKFQNTFPGFYYIVYWLECKNVGTIPAKIKEIRLANVIDPDNIRAYVLWKQDAIRIYKPDGSVRWSTSGFDWTKLDDVPQTYYNKLKDQVLYPGERLRFSLLELPPGEGEEGSFTIKLSETLDKAEGYTISYDLVFEWTQFNAP
jgi:hypothetical protein